MPLLPARAVVLSLAVALTLSACGDAEDAAERGAEPTPSENISEAEPEGVGGTSND